MTIKQFGTGSLSAQDINSELGVSITSSLSLNDTNARLLAGKTTTDSIISYYDFYGKSYNPIVSGGQTVVVSGGYKYHVFSAAGTLTITNMGSSDLEILTIGAGGGGAGKRGGGGGGGGVTYESYSASSVNIGSYTVVVGAGGARAPTPDIWGGSSASSGQSTYVYYPAGRYYMALGGGGGGAGFFNYPGRDGSSNNGNGGG